MRENFAHVIEMLAQNLDLPRLAIAETKYPEHRQLCLYSCGLGLSLKQLDDTVKKMVGEDQHTKAAALALMHGQVKLAGNALKSSNTSATHRELSLAVAGYAIGNTDSTWDETVQGLAVGLDDPYARAILALVRHGDWHDVLAETSLPLRDRVSIALMYLPDEELSQYVNTTTAEVIKYGDIEGIILTGLTNQSVSFFETYIRKFSDLQTAVLALAHASPRYFTDPRVTMWRETYRSWMNQWQMYPERAHFDVQVTKLSTSPQGQPTLPLSPRQVTVRCKYCEQPLDRNASNVTRPQESNSSFGTHQGSIFGDAKSGIVCPKCGRHLPRCVICSHWLGMSDGHGKSGMAATANATKESSMANFISSCYNCHHMSHGEHAMQWFALHRTCPANGCKCHCGEMDAGIRRS